MSTIPPQIQPILLTRKSCAAALGISIRKLDSLIATKQLPAGRIGSKGRSPK